MRVLALGFVLVALLALVGCAQAPLDSGIKGTVTIGPTAPLAEPGQSQESPYAARIVIKNAKGKQVAGFDTGADGFFSVTLPPGEYVVEPQTQGTLPFAKSQQVTVEPHRFSTVRVRFDSGIR